MKTTGRRASLIAFAAAAVMACDSPVAPPRTDAYAFRVVGSDLVFRWPSARLPVRFHVEQRGAMPEYVQAGIDLWERQFLYGEFRGDLVTDPASADVEITLSGGEPPEAPLTNDPPVNTCTGETTVPPFVVDGEGNTVVDQHGRVQLSDKLRVTLRWFSHPDPSAIANCLARVTAHEIGHTLGIFAADHAGTNPTDLMFSPPSVRRPSQRDRVTVELLYHQQPDIAPSGRTSSQ